MMAKLVSAEPTARFSKPFDTQVAIDRIRQVLSGAAPTAAAPASAGTPGVPNRVTNLGSTMIGSPTAAPAGAPAAKLPSSAGTGSMGSAGTAGSRPKATQMFGPGALPFIPTPGGAAPGPSAGVPAPAASAPKGSPSPPPTHRPVIRPRSSSRSTAKTSSRSLLRRCLHRPPPRRKHRYRVLRLRPRLVLRSLRVLDWCQNRDWSRALPPRSLQRLSGPCACASQPSGPDCRRLRQRPHPCTLRYS